MTDRTEVLEAVMDCLLVGILVFGRDGEVVYWNQSAAAMMGYSESELLGRHVPESLRSLCPGGTLHLVPETGHSTMVHPVHKLGHEVQVINRTTVLHNLLGEPIGEASIFRPAKRLDALPSGVASGGKNLQEEISGIEERLRDVFDEFQCGGLPFGVLWISIDQAVELRKSHGVAACHEMTEKVHRALSRGLRPGDAMGRWGYDEFLIVAHESNLEILAAHARTLAALARTANFRWWGDLLSLTVSIGIAQPRQRLHETLDDLLERAQAAMGVSIAAGGNTITVAPMPNPGPILAGRAAATSLHEHSIACQCGHQVTEGEKTCLP